MSGRLPNRLGALALSLAAATGLWGHAAAAPCGGPAEVSRVVLMTDWLPVTLSQGPFWEAQLRGYYKDEGFDVELIAPANPADPIKLVARERVNFSLTYVPEVLMSRDTGIPVVAIATTLRKIVSGLTSLDESGISSPADLKGKTVGQNVKMDAQAYLDTILADGGLGRDDVKVIDPGYAGISLALAGKVHAFHSLHYGEWMMINMELAKMGKKPARFLAYTDHGVPQFYYQLIVGNENWIERNPHATCRFLRASRKGLETWLEDADSLAIQHAIKANDIFTEAMHRESERLAKPDWVAADGTIFHQVEGPWETARDWAMKYKLISVGDDPGTYFTNAYIPWE